MHTTNIIGFPGLGIGPFKINTVAFSIFGRDIAWYGIFVTLGILSGIFYAFWRGQKNNGINVDDMIDVAIFSIPAAIIGARIYYIIFNLSSFPTFYSFIEIWNGGLAVYGGVIFGLGVGFAVCKFKKLSVLKVFDSVAPAIMLGQIIGRWGNFTNAEAYGSKTSLPWRMSINSTLEVHPTFLYESLWNLVGFIIINIIYKKKKFDGQIFLIYITWYGFGRMLIEQLRADSLYLGSFRISQVVGLLCFIAGIILIILSLKKSKIKKLKNEAYEKVYSSVMLKLPELQELSDESNENNSKIEKDTEDTEEIKITEGKENTVIDKIDKTDDTNN